MRNGWCVVVLAACAMCARAEARTASGSFGVMVEVIDRCTVQSVPTVPRGQPVDPRTMATARCTAGGAYDVAVAPESVAPIVSASQLTGIGEDAQSRGGYVLFSNAAHGGAPGGNVEIDPVARASVRGERGAGDTGAPAIQAVSVTVSF